MSNTFQIYEHIIEYANMLSVEVVQIIVNNIDKMNNVFYTTMSKRTFLDK